MRSLWRDADARRMVASLARRGVNRDVGACVYATRLLGGDPRLVLHGGGNTSVKTTMRDVLGTKRRVLCVKGSGWDMGSIEPRGLPALRLEDLLESRTLDELSDHDMVNLQRGCLLDATSPNPSVETLLHAFLPHKFVLHTHSTAVLALTDQRAGTKLAGKVFGSRAPLVPYVMPGFALSRKAAEVADSHPGCEGLVLLKHGIFSFDDSAREAYERMIRLVSMAEKRLAEGRRNVFAAAPLPKRRAPQAEVAPVLRGLLATLVADADPARMVLEFRTGKAIRNFVDGKDVERYGQAGVVTPDHSIRIKNWPMIVAAPARGRLDEFRTAAAHALGQFAGHYRSYFARNNGRRDVQKKELDALPRVILVPGLGLFGAGKSVNEARVAADLAENNIEVITDAEAIGRFESLEEADLFDMEYWSLEQAKLGKGSEQPLARRVALITGGGSGIGEATVRLMAREGAAVVIVDRDPDAVEDIASGIGSAALGVVCDVTDSRAVRRAFEAACKAFGGVDIVVSNAGAAWQGEIGTVSDEILRQSFELNFFAHQTVAQNAVRVMKAQGTGGALLFNASKQAVNPGPDFGPYGLAKAATLSLVRQYALEYGADGITANAVNADRVNTGLFAGGVLESRAAARGITVEEYLGAGNLLRREVKVDDVAKAFLDLALSRKTTAAVITVDGGNIAAALR